MPLEIEARKAALAQAAPVEGIAIDRIIGNRQRLAQQFIVGEPAHQPFHAERARQSGDCRGEAAKLVDRLPIPVPRPSQVRKVAAVHCRTAFEIEPIGGRILGCHRQMQFRPLDRIGKREDQLMAEPAEQAR